MNEQYPFGMDWYSGNRVNSWAALVQWDWKMRFAYFRLGIGTYADPPDLLNGAHENTTWDLGGFYEVGLPVIPKDRMVGTLRDALAKSGAILSLPVSLAFEPQGWVRRTPLWPSVGDLGYIDAAIRNLGYRTNIYTNQSGLDVIKASRLIDMTTMDLWYSSTYAFPLWSTERPVDSIVSFLQTKYGIQHEHVQFIQTVIDHGNSPIGSGQDFDRAVSWNFDQVPPEPIPVPEPNDLKSVAITVRSERAELASVSMIGDTSTLDVTSLSTLTVVPFPVTPPAPTPEPPPAPTKNLYRLLKDNELPASYGYNGMSRTASPSWGGNPMTPATVRLHGADPVKNLSDAAVRAVHLLNDPHNAFVYVTRTSAGWSNRGQTWPETLEPIAFEGNLVDVTRIEGRRAYLRMWNGELDDDCVIHRWWNIDKDSVLHDAQNNVTEGPAYIVLAYPGEYWIEIDRLVKV